MYYVLLARYLHYNIMLDKLNVKNRRIHQITVGHTLINQMIHWTMHLQCNFFNFLLCLDRLEYLRNLMFFCCVSVKFVSLTLKNFPTNGLIN